MYYRRELGDFSCLCLESLRISTMLKSSWGWDRRSKSRFSWLVEGYTRALLSRTWWWSTLWDRLESTWGEGMVLWLSRREQGSSHMQRTHAMMAQGQQARWALSEAMGETVPCLCTSFSECWQSGLPCLHHPARISAIIFTCRSSCLTSLCPNFSF